MSLSRAFRQRQEKFLKDRDVVTDDEFRSLLAAAARGANGLQHTAILWCLRDAGFRVSELLALNVGSVSLQADGSALLSLPKGAPFLKTGPRNVPVKRAVPALRAWMDHHPLRADAAAPLFLSVSPRSPFRRLEVQSVNQFLRRFARFSGVRHIRPHDLRHTRCTEAARGHHQEAELRKFFGWSKTSRMAAHYTHLRDSDLRVMADARNGFDSAPAAPANVGPPPPPPAGSAPQQKGSMAAAVAAAVAAAMAATGAGG